MATNSSFEVERVLDERFDELGEREYLILWRGFGLDEATWEPRASLMPACKKLIEDFRSKQIELGRPVIGAFTGKSFTIERSFRAKEKQEVSSLISANGGAISLILSKTTGFVVVPSLQKLEESVISAAARFGAVIVELAHIRRCATEDRFLAPPPLPAIVAPATSAYITSFSEARTEPKAQSTAVASGVSKLFAEISSLAPAAAPAATEAVDLTKASLTSAITDTKANNEVAVKMEETAPAPSLERVPKGLPLGSTDAPFFNERGYEVAKFCCLTRRKGHVRRFIALELHVTTAAAPSGQAITHPFRVYVHKGLAHDVAGTPDKHLCWYFKTLPEASKLYTTLFNNKTIAAGYAADTVAGRRVGSEKAPYTAEETLPADLAQLVQRLYDDANSFLFAECSSNMKALSFTDAPNAVSFELLDRAEAILLDAARAVALAQPSEEGEAVNADLERLSKEYVDLFATVHVTVEELSGIEAVDRQLAFTQVVRDITSVREGYESGSTPLSLQYRALRCRLEVIPLESPEVAHLVEQFKASDVLSSKRSRVALRRIFALHRPAEAAAFESELANRRLLFHGSRRANWLGILSRGLMLPRSVLRRAGTRTDAGMLGAGIYFSDSVATAAKYAEPSTQESFYITAAQVALGDSKDFTEPAPHLTAPPSPYHSCRSVKSSASHVTAFVDSEYVVYRTNQQRLVYLLECELEAIAEEAAAEAEVEPEVELDASFSDFVAIGNTDGTGEEEQGETEGHGDDVEVVEEEEEEEEAPRAYVGYNPDFPFATPPVAPSAEAAPQKPNAALIDLHSGKPITLVSAHIRARIVDFAAEVQLFHLYRNTATVPVEAQFTFPLPDLAAVCGFECHIGNRVVVAKIREKQEAHAEYAEAVNKRHGAYLLDATEVTGVFTTRVGNLPARTEALVKITFVVELQPAPEERGARGVVLRFPSKFAPGAVGARSAQNAVPSLAAQATGESMLTVQVGAEMADEISVMSVPQVEACAKKRSATKACVAFRTPLGGPDLDIIVRTKQSNPSRMWVEEGAKDSFAAMLVFFPDFKPPPPEPLDVTFLLDCSTSMRGAALERAQAALTKALDALSPRASFNVVCFGARERRLFVEPMPARYADLRTRALQFVSEAKADLGVSDVYSSLQQLYLQALPEGGPRAIFLFTDGFVLEESRCLSLASRHSARTRLFTFGSGPSPNRGFLLSLARAGAGEAEILTSDVLPKDAAARQLRRAEQPAFHSMSVRWQLTDAAAASVLTAPAQLRSVYRGERLIVYGFLPRDCTQATLVARQGATEHTHTVYAPPASFLHGDLVHRLAARAAIDDFERGVFAADSAAHAVAARKARAGVLALSLKHSVLSSLTSFFAVERRVAGAHPTGPAPLAKALAAAVVDPLPYVAWSGDAPPELEAPPAAAAANQPALGASGLLSESLGGDADEPEEGGATPDAPEEPVAAADAPAPLAPQAAAPRQPMADTPANGFGALDVPMRRAKVVVSRGSAPAPAARSGGGKTHGGLSTPVVTATRTGGASYPRAGRKQRSILTSTGGVVALSDGSAQALVSHRNRRPPGKQHAGADLAPRVTPFGLTAHAAPEALSDSRVSWVLRGPLNVGGTCWLDAAVALIASLAPVRGAVLSAPPYAEPPSSPHYNPSGVLPALQALLRFWLGTDNRAHEFHKRVSPLVERLWRNMSELGLRYAVNQCAAHAVELMLAHLASRGVASRAFAIGHCKGASLACELGIAFKPEFLVLRRSDAPALQLEQVECEWPHHYLYAFIAFRHLQSIGATEVNHYITVCLSREEDAPWGCGYFLLDDVLQLRPGVWQGGFVPCTSPARVAAQLKELLVEVPLIVLRRKH